MNSFANITAPLTGVLDRTKYVHYALGMVLGVSDFDQEFTYLSDRDRLLARELIGYGTVCGLGISLDTSQANDPQVFVEPGIALTPPGQFVSVAPRQCAHLNDWLKVKEHAKTLSDTNPKPTSIDLYVVLSYDSCLTDGAPIPGEACRSDDQTMAPSREQDSFKLELNFTPPTQLEADLTNKFLGYLKEIKIVDVGVSTSRTDFEKAVHDLQQLLRPKPGVLPIPNPLLMIQINAADVSQYMKTALRVWVTVLRPICLDEQQTPDGALPKENRLLLAHLNVPLLQTPDGNWVVNGTNIMVDEESRPILVPLRLLEDWQFGISSSSVNAVQHPPNLPVYSLVAAGIAKLQNPTPRQTPSYNGLSITKIIQEDAPGHDALITVAFAGYRQPDSSFNYIVKALPVKNPKIDAPVVSFDHFLPTPAASPGDAFVLRISDAGKTIPLADAQDLELMIEVSQYQ